MTQGSIRLALPAEWTKLRTVAGTYWLLFASIALTVGLSALVVAAVNYGYAGATEDTAKLSLTGMQLGQATVAILAVLMISSEYGTGMIRATLTAMPHRSVVLAAEAVVVTSAVLTAGTVACLGSLLTGRLILPRKGSPPRAATRRCHWPTVRRCAPPPARCSTSP